MTKHQNGRIIDFLGRLHRFQNAILERLSGETLEDLKHTRMRQIALDQVSKQSADTIETNKDIPVEKRGLLLKQVEQYFSLAELNSLCFQLGIEHENIEGNRRDAKAQNLIEYTMRHGVYMRFIQEVAGQRPHLDWNQFEPPSTSSLEAIAGPILIRMESLQQLYQNSIIADGYQGISRDMVIETYQLNSTTGMEFPTPLLDMTKICQALEIGVEDPFQTVRKIIETHLT
jgi:hypothetical protein